METSDATFGKSSMHNIDFTFFSALSSGVGHDALLCASTGTQVSTEENDLSGILTAAVLVYFVGFNGHVSCKLPLRLGSYFFFRVSVPNDLHCVE